MMNGNQTSFPVGTDTLLTHKRENEMTPASLEGQTLGKYRVLEPLGRGGMADVYEAETPDGTRVAVKVIGGEAAQLGSDAHRRFMREARAAKSIQSPHVVQTLDAGTDETQKLPFLVMELMRGVDMSAMLKRQGALEPTVVVRAIIQAGRGVAAAHARGIVHENLTPERILVSRWGEPKIRGLGLAREGHEESSSTPAPGPYTAPELSEGEG